ncbi:MAG: hypothetical protein ACRDJ0_07805 [Actinomycetota bacterium]
MAATSLHLSREAAVLANGQHREVPETQSLAGDDGNAAAPEILQGALLALSAGAVRIGLQAAGKGARFARGVAARAVMSSPLQHRVNQLNDRWDEDRRVLLERFDGALASVVGMVLDRIDLTRLVIERVDVNRIIEERVDIDGVIERTDIIGVARDVVQQLDLPEIIRESSGTMGTETIEGLRLRGMDADRSLSRLVDRVLNRTNGREASPS